MNTTDVLHQPAANTVSADEVHQLRYELFLQLIRVIGMLGLAVGAISAVVCIATGFRNIHVMILAGITVADLAATGIAVWLLKKSHVTSAILVYLSATLLLTFLAGVVIESLTFFCIAVRCWQCLASRCWSRSMPHRSVL